MKKYKIKTLKKKTKEEELVKHKLLHQICLNTKGRSTYNSLYILPNSTLRALVKDHKYYTKYYTNPIKSMK